MQSYRDDLRRLQGLKAAQQKGQKHQDRAEAGQDLQKTHFGWRKEAKYQMEGKEKGRRRLSSRLEEWNGWKEGVERC